MLHLRSHPLFAIRIMFTPNCCSDLGCTSIYLCSGCLINYHSNMLGKGTFAMRILIISKCLMFLSSIFEMKMWSSCISYQIETVHSLGYILENLSSKDDTIPCLLPGCPSYYSSTSTINGLVCPISYDSKENR